MTASQKPAQLSADRHCFKLGFDAMHGAGVLVDRQEFVVAGRAHQHGQVTVPEGMYALPVLVIQRGVRLRCLNSSQAKALSAVPA